MPQPGLHLGDIGTVIERVGGAGRSQRMGTEALDFLSFVQRSRNAFAQRQRVLKQHASFW